MTECEPECVSKRTHLEGLVGLGDGQNLVPVVHPARLTQLAQQALTVPEVELQLLLIVLRTRQHLRQSHTYFI